MYACSPQVIACWAISNYPCCKSQAGPRYMAGNLSLRVQKSWRKEEDYGYDYLVEMGGHSIARRAKDNSSGFSRRDHYVTSRGKSPELFCFLKTIGSIRRIAGTFIQKRVLNRTMLMENNQKIIVTY